MTIPNTIITGTENKYLYNGIEFNSTFGVDAYEAHFRALDPQLGMWWQVDPKVDKYPSLSPYASMGDDPIRNADPLGDEDKDLQKKASSKPKTTSATNKGPTSQFRAYKPNIFGKIRSHIENHLSHPRLSDKMNPWNALTLLLAKALYNTADNTKILISGVGSAHPTNMEGFVLNNNEQLNAKFSAFMFWGTLTLGAAGAEASTVPNWRECFPLVPHLTESQNRPSYP